MPIVAGFLVYKLTPHLTGAKVLLIIALVPVADGATNGAIAWPVWTALEHAARVLGDVPRPPS